ncbi:unnamed protein product [Leptidea sinapis]|uniref:Dynein light chain 1, axonemal n=1 Tax=Leptidea sinapis TaxID=189913 RepID=A0A5E4QWZ6_9NEOP|nr:unnamed protein product [Leptidea sinapis]
MESQFAVEKKTKITHFECLGDTLEELWISYNLVEKLKGIHVLRSLKVLYMSNNLVKEWSEFNKLQELPNLEDLLFVGNPLYDACELEVWRAEAARRLPALRKLDGENVLREDDPPITVADMQTTWAVVINTIETLTSTSMEPPSELVSSPAVRFMQRRACLCSRQLGMTAVHTGHSPSAGGGVGRRRARSRRTRYKGWYLLRGLSNQWEPYVYGLYSYVIGTNTELFEQ